MFRIQKYIHILIIVGLAMFLWQNRTLYPVPDSDVFQYINDGRLYIKGQIPPNVHAPPANPFLIVLLSHFFSFSQKEIVTAVFINIISTVLIAVGIIYTVDRSHPILPTIVLVFFAASPLTYISGVNVTSEVLFTALAALVFYLRQQKKEITASIFIGISFLVRYEGIILLISAAVIDLLSKKFKPQKLIPALLIIISWLIVAHFHNPQQNITGNTFIQEISAGKHKIPNISIITAAPSLIVFNYFHYWLSPQIIRALIFLSMIGILIFSRNISLKEMVLFAVGYTGLHMMFPEYSSRYLFPLIWLIPYFVLHCMFYLISLIKHYFDVKFYSAAAAILFLVTTSIIYQNYSKICVSLLSKQYSGYEHRMVAQWINTTAFTHPTVILTLEPWITDYYTHSTNVKFVYIPMDYIEQCKEMSCLTRFAKLAFPNHTVVVITDSYTTSDRGKKDTWSKKFGIDLFYDFENSNQDKRLIHQETFNQSSFRAYLLN